MSFAGTEVYNVDASPVLARGSTVTDSELDNALRVQVAEILRDDRGAGELQQLLSTVSITGFQQQNLERALKAPASFPTWRIGEALAETFVVQTHQCVFPWPTGRDVKNPSASPAGADLVGFEKTDATSNSYRFAFGEAKTSQEERWPPNVMYSRSGMIRQLELLRDSTRAKDTLFRYLGYHAVNATWSYLFQSAAARYLNNSTDISLFGLLIRDVEPHSEDLRTRAIVLSVNCPAQTSIRLQGIYLPPGSIGSLVARAKNYLEQQNGSD